MQKFHIYRFEFKYILNFRQYNAICKEILNFMDYDPYSMVASDKSYLVASIYYDSLDNITYWDKIDGQENRKKFRFRTYTLNPDEKPSIYLEIKRKKDMVIIKDRAELKYETYVAMLNTMPAILFQEKLPSDQKKVVEEFVYMAMYLNMSPKVCVTYKREALVGKYHSNIRVTFDRDIKGYNTANLFSKWNIENAPLPGQVVLELKFNGSLPVWFHYIIQKYNLLRVACSKYCETMTKCNGILY